MPHNHPHIEILAPVGGSEHLIAAVRSGADAVYLGTQSFNARRNAHNFTDDELKDAVKYCHVRGVRLYLTLNTLIFNNELDAVKKAVINAAKSGVDALITQDLAVYSIAKNLFPDLPLHASTQMTVHNREGAIAVRDMGFKRVVLARELSEREISYINSNLGIETEIFIHGAHCMSISGACYLSQTLGERSANRGLCAQPCRLDFKNKDTDYCLSLKDMSLIPILDRVIKTGVTSLKIEGRMKRPEYVAAAVSQAVNALNCVPADMDTLESVFSRNGFTNGYFVGNIGAGMFGIRRREDAEVSKNVLSDIAQNYRIEKGRVEVSVNFYAKKGENIFISVTDGVNTCSFSSAPPDSALKRPTQEEDVREKLIMTGNTPYNVTKCSIEMDDGLFIPASKIGEMRRCVFDSLTAERCKHKQYVQHTYDECVTLEKSPIHTSQGIVIRAESIYQLKHISSCMEIILPAEHILKNSSECISRAKQMGAELIAEAPEIMFPGDEEKYPVMLKTLWDIGIKAVSVSNISHIAPTKRLGMKIKGSYGLNITNDIALKEYAALGVSDAVLSFELSSSAIASVRSDMGRGIIAYGRLPVMKTRACPVMGKGGCKSCTQKSISDRMSKRLPILCREHKYSVILSPVPVWLFDKEIKNTDYSVIYFTTESPEEAAHVFELARKRASADFEFTRGSFGRSVL